MAWLETRSQGFRIQFRFNNERYTVPLNVPGKGPGKKSVSHESPDVAVLGSPIGMESSMELTEAVKANLIETARALHGHQRRLFLARTVQSFGRGGQRLAKNGTRMESRQDDLTLGFTTSPVTSDFIVDMLARWRREKRPQFPQVHALVLNQDYGPEIPSRRTQFLKRMVAFARVQRLLIRSALRAAVVNGIPS